jgi:predicted secreted protein
MENDVLDGMCNTRETFQSENLKEGPNFRETVCKNVGWIQVAHVRVQSRDFVNMVMDLWFP